MSKVYRIIVSGTAYSFESPHEMTKYLLEWIHEGKNVQRVDRVTVQEYLEGSNVSKTEELARLARIRNDFVTAKDSLIDMEDIVGMGDSTGHLDTALLAAITDLDGYIEARTPKWRVFFQATPNHSTTKTGSIQHGLTDYTTLSDATARADKENAYWASRANPGQQIWFVGVKKVED